jgi:hypothetical protein
MASISPNLTLLATLLQHEIKNTFVVVGEGKAIWMSNAFSNKSHLNINEDNN